MTDLATYLLPTIGGGILAGVIAVVGQVIQAGKTKLQLDLKEKADAVAKVEKDKADAAAAAEEIRQQQERERAQADRHLENKQRFEKLEQILSMGSEGLFITRREAALKDEATAGELRRMNARLGDIETDVGTLVRRGGGRGRRTG